MDKREDVQLLSLPRARTGIGDRIISQGLKTDNLMRCARTSVMWNINIYYRYLRTRNLPS